MSTHEPVDRFNIVQWKCKSTTGYRHNVGTPAIYKQVTHINTTHVLEDAKSRRYTTYIVGEINVLLKIYFHRIADARKPYSHTVTMVTLNTCHTSKYSIQNCIGFAVFAME